MASGAARSTGTCGALQLATATLIAVRLRADVYFNSFDGSDYPDGGAGGDSINAFLQARKWELA